MNHIILDSGPLGMVTSPRASGITLECQLWLESQLQQGSIVLIPEIADYEVRRELIRANKPQSVQQLDRGTDRLNQQKDDFLEGTLRDRLCIIRNDRRQ